MKQTREVVVLADGPKMSLGAVRKVRPLGNDLAYIHAHFSKAYALACVCMYIHPCSHDACICIHARTQ